VCTRAVLNCTSTSKASATNKNTQNGTCNVAAVVVLNSRSTFNCVCVCVCDALHTHTEREREREREMVQYDKCMLLQERKKCKERLVRFLTQ